MLAMKEWCMYATGPQHKGLRVSSSTPNTAQRSNYFLSVSLKWAIPSTVSLAVLHWIVSEAVFFSNLDIYRLHPDGVPGIERSGYVYTSAIPTIIALCLASVIFIALIVAAVVPEFPDNVPLSGYCSASIAAACQPARVGPDNETPRRDFDPDLSSLMLKVGGVERPDDDPENIGHATFSAGEATPLKESRLYA
ncbi:hypothetical protein BDW62DRAFT_204105 [Aspergillus aurantiobrunneus]